MSSDHPGTKNLQAARLQIIKKIIEGYDGLIPLHYFLKNFFSKNKNFGSTDRKIYSSWTYSYYRLGKALIDEDQNIRLAIGYFLVHGNTGELIHYLSQQYSDLKFANYQCYSVEDRINLVSEFYPAFNINDIFPFTESLSDGIDRRGFNISLLTQPKVFIRVLPNKESFFLGDIQKNNLVSEVDVEVKGCYAFEPPANLLQTESYLKGGFEVQDRSSQIAGNKIPANINEHWWDCCCGAGGKSLQLLSHIKSIQLTASDKRITIIDNFVNRLKKYPGLYVNLLPVDLESDQVQTIFDMQFDGIIADVPCSGSGTWSRTPDRLTSFNSSELEGYVTRQKLIVTNAIRYLKPGGKLTYITCSVFKCENEDIALWISEILKMRLIESGTINGISSRSDSMYYANFAF